MDEHNVLTTEMNETTEILLESARPRMYMRNAFRVLELPVTATVREVMKRQQVFEIARKMGRPIPPGPAGYLPLESEPDEDAVRQAVQRLQDPERRMVDELFWFWPNAMGEDEGLASLLQGDVEQAKKIWINRAEQMSESYVSMHNLAVLSHVTALEFENNGHPGKEAAAHWITAYRYWKEVLEYEGFWSQLTARIRDLNDPRLTSGLARRMRETLPAALLSINARLGVEAAEKGMETEVKRHLKILSDSGWETKEVLSLALESVRERIDMLSKKAEHEADADPVHGDKAADRLLNETRPLLRILDWMLPPDHPTRVGAHDEVARRLLGCQITFGNKTENWKKSLQILEQTVSIAISESIKTRIKENLEIVKSNAESGSSWIMEGYFELPEGILSAAENARSYAEAHQWDEAITILKETLTDKSGPRLPDTLVPLLRKPLAHCLNMRALSILNPAMDQYNEPPSVLRMVADRAERGGYGFNITARVAEIGQADGVSLECMACGSGIYDQYMRMRYENIPFIICMGCSTNDEREKNNKMTKLSNALLKAADDLFLAQQLDRTNENIEANIESFTKLSKQLGVKLPTREMILLEFLQSGMATLSQLIEASIDDANRVRKVAKKALANVGPENSDSIYDIIVFSINPLIKIKLKHIESILEKLDKNWPKSKAAKKAIPKLVVALRDDSSAVRIRAAEILGKIGSADNSAVSELIPALINKNRQVRYAAKRALNAIDKDWKNLNAAKRFRHLFLQALNNKNVFIVKAAFDALKMIDPRSVSRKLLYRKITLSITKSFLVPILILAIIGTTPVISYSIWKYLHGDPNEIYRFHRYGLLTEETTVSSLIPTITHQDPNKLEDIITAITILGEMGLAAKDTVPALIPKLKDPNPYVRRATLDTLISIGQLPSEAIQLISYSFGDNNSEWFKEYVVNALGKYNGATEDILSIMLLALQDNNESVKISAIDTFGRLGPAAKDAMPHLMLLLIDENESIRRHAENALGKIDENWAHSNIGIKVIVPKEDKYRRNY